MLPRLARSDRIAWRCSSVMARCAPPGECGRKSTPFRPSKLRPLNIPYSGVSWCVSCGVFSSPIQEPGADRSGGRGLIRQGPLFPSAPSLGNGSLSCEKPTCENMSRRFRSLRLHDRGDAYPFSRRKRWKERRRHLRREFLEHPHRPRDVTIAQMDHP